MIAWVLVAPRLRIARFLAGTALSGFAGKSRGVLLPYPRDIEEHVRDFVYGIIEWRRLLEKVKRAGMSYVRSWAWIEEPLLGKLRLLHELGAGFDVRCYGPSTMELFQLTGEILKLVFRVRVTGKVDLESWRRILKTEIKIPLREVYVTFSSVQPKIHGVEVIDVWKYPIPPTERLSLETLSQDTVKNYVSYMFDYIIESKNVDEAYLKWLNDKGMEVPENLKKLAKLLVLKDI